MKNLLDINGSEDDDDNALESEPENEITSDEKERKIVQEKLDASANEALRLTCLRSGDDDHKIVD
ncbi:unnamed protein product [Cylicostephanus goldi]|uniref:Uncharacterized protein n=1 Tax=Cylicostephanus goldi TaxID=71465 RepID=A0A3P7M509_CYLGO|nr:unnamed protein product [Cylicostephanus goldi]